MNDNIIQNSINHKDIRNLDICFLVVFGHSANDWLHSLIDGHEQVLILPSFSFYRTWNSLKCDNISTKEEMCSVWRAYAYKNSRKYFAERKLFFNDIEVDKFCKKFNELIDKNGIERIDVFYSIHEAYSFARDLDLSNKRIIVSHEHLPFFFESIMKDFPKTKIMMLMRDPRAVMSGSIRVTMEDRDFLCNYDFNMFFEAWIEGENIWKKCLPELGAKRIKMFINEKLNSDLETEAKDLANWLGVEMSDSLLVSTLSGIKWGGESAYMTTDNQLPSPEKEFYNINNVTKRWKTDLSENELIMIEFMCKYSMKEFGYERTTKDTIFSRLKGFFVFLLPPRGLMNRWKNNPKELVGFEWIPDRLGNGIFGSIWKILPDILKIYSIVVYAGCQKAKNYFFPGVRIKRYL
ncbi:MAG: sulfotransferase [Candidatus Omnitrophica bacterium]|nr:sulfotransferase [Candidatus Omnitrophota bacterium]MBU4333893.1 sulfotransferase [Candidatus Omnitrophota bacterium]